MISLLSALMLPHAVGALPSAAEDAIEPPSVGLVAPDIISVRVRRGRVEHGSQVPFALQEGDTVERKSHHRWVHRGGKFIGSLVGADEKILHTPDRVVGPKLDTAWADRVGTYQIGSPDDPNYREAAQPLAVYRKSRPTDFARVGSWQYEAPMEHTLYLKMPRRPAVGKTYVIRFEGARLPETSFSYEPARMLSEAVHVSHLGFRPDDSRKVAFLSCWMGAGGGIEYRAPLGFQVLDGNGKPAFEGKVSLAKAAGDKTEDAYKRNYNGADVHEMDFSALKKAGMYRVCVEGIGCSYPFEISDDVWRKAFIVSARGFYHQRSGIELGPPYTTFKRPRCFHPDDGVKVYHSNCALMDSGNGLNRSDNNFGNLNKGRTDRIVSDAWGGYMDAGDWDRRIQHLAVSRLLLELADLFPSYFAAVSLNIPESGGALPDIVDEALFNLDCYRRMQTPEGGIRGGIESEEHPRHGEESRQESLAVMAYAPGIWSSHVYAGVAARAACWLETRKPDLAKLYRESALRAARWAEKELEAAGDRKFPNEARDSRNLAAAELFRLTGDARWKDIFLATTFFKDPKNDLSVWQSHDQRDAAWVCVRTERPGMDEQVRANCRNAVIREADERLASQARAGFRWMKYGWRPFAWGAPVAPEGESVARAHVITGEARYLSALVLACQMGAGANPLNLCYTTGLGHQWPQHPLHIDSRITHQPPPPGITVFGPQDAERSKNDWGRTLVGRFCFPSINAWPAMESYWDVFWYPQVCEFTVQTPMAVNAYVWGYLAARDSSATVDTR